MIDILIYFALFIIGICVVVAVVQSLISGLKKTLLGSSTSKCKFCGSRHYGFCDKSPHRKHQHTSDGEHCIWCGTTHYKSGMCDHSPRKRHEL